MQAIGADVRSRVHRNLRRCSGSDQHVEQRRLQRMVDPRVELAVRVGARAALAVLAALAFAACSQPDDGVVSMQPDQLGNRKDLPPVALNAESPIEYPRPLFDQGIEGSVLLRLYVDSTGAMVPDSSRVLETSGYPARVSPASANTRQRSESTERSSTTQRTMPS